MGHITFNSTGMVSLVDAIGGLDHIASVGTDLKGWYLDNVITKMKAGEISFSGNYKAPDFETLTKAGVQLVIDTVRLAENPEVIAKYDELGIPWMIESSSKEGHPLGRVEWVKLFGTLIGMKEESDRYFSQQAEKVAQVKSADATGKTVAMVYMSSDGSKVFCRNGGDYMASMINLAGGEYIMKDLEPGKTGTTSVTMEAFYAACKDADYLFYVNHVQKFKTLEDMVAFNPLFADLKAVKEGQVYITSPDFSQSTAAIAGIIADMHAVLSNASIESTHALNKLQ
jgi:iron complex transport system substrate-binding protein